MKNTKINYAMKNRVVWLEKFYKLRNFDLKNKTSEFFCIYFSTMLSTMGLENAKKKLRLANERSFQPLDKAKIELIINEVCSKKYRYRNETIVKKLRISDKEIDKLGIDSNKRKELERIERKNLRIKQKAEIIEKFKCGMSYAELEQEYKNFGRSTIRNLLSPYAKIKKEEKIKKVFLLHEQGYSIRKIAKILSCSKNTVNKYILSQKSFKTQDKEFDTLNNSRLKFMNSTVEEFFILKKDQMLHKSKNVSLKNKLSYSKNNILITGAAGTGKTYLIKQYLRNLSKRERNKILILAPTGIASSHLNGCTIHAGFNLKLCVQEFNNDVEIPKKLLKIDTIIIDEINMVRIDLFDKIIEIIKLIEKNHNHHIRIIMLGDFGQISPVVSKEDKVFLKTMYPSSKNYYVFESQNWKNLNLEVIRLFQNQRQLDPIFYEKLMEIKYGCINALRWFNEVCGYQEDPNAIYLCPTRKLVNYYNNKAISKFDAESLYEYRAEIVGKVTNFQDLPCQKLKLAIGMPVRCTINTKKYKNGDIGTITKLNQKNVWIKLNNGGEVKVEPKTFLTDDGTYKQFPLDLAFAITVNKAEGCTFDKVNIVPGFFAAGQLYVALSRVKKLQGVNILGQLQKKDLIVDEAALSWTV